MTLACAPLGPEEQPPFRRMTPHLGALSRRHHPLAETFHIQTEPKQRFRQSQSCEGAVRKSQGQQLTRCVWHQGKRSQVVSTMCWTCAKCPGRGRYPAILSSMAMRDSDDGNHVGSLSPTRPFASTGFIPGHKAQVTSHSVNEQARPEPDQDS